MPKFSAHLFSNSGGRRGGCAWLLCSLLLVCRVAAAQDGRDRCLRDPACRQLSERAGGEYRDQRYYNAWRLLKDAYAMSQEPRLLVNLGRCLEKLGLVNEAVAAYERFLAEDTLRDPAERERVQKYLQQARTAPAAAWDGKNGLTPPAAPQSGTPTEPSPADIEPPPAALLLPTPDAALPSPGPGTVPGVSGALVAEAKKEAGTKKESAASPRPWIRSPWLWLGVGAGVTCLALGLGLGLGLSQSPRYYIVEWQ